MENPEPKDQNEQSQEPKENQAKKNEAKDGQDKQVEDLPKEQAAKPENPSDEKKHRIRLGKLRKTEETAEKTEPEEEKSAKASNHHPKVKNIDQRDIKNSGGNYFEHLQGEVHLNYNSSEKTFKDPTDVLSSKPSGLPIFENLTLLGDLDFAREERVVVLSCQDHNLILSAVYDWLENADQEGVYEKRMLYFSPENLKRKDLYLDLLASEKIGKNEQVICVVDVKSQTFLESLFVDNWGTTRIQDKLRQKDTIVLCLVSSKLIKNFDLQLTKQPLEFPHIELPFLNSLLVHYWSGENISYIKEQLEKQRQKKLWGNPDSEQDFYAKLGPFFSSGDTSLMQAIEKRNDVQTYQKDKITGVERLLGEANQIEKIVLFVATFFPGLRPSDLKLLVNLLVGEQKEISLEKVTMTDKDGNERMIEKKKEVLLSEIWSKKADKIIERSRLMAVKEANGAKIMAFDDPALGDAFKDYFEKRLSVFCIDQYEMILNSGILFNRSISEVILKNAIQLFADMATSEPEALGTRLLFNITQSIFGTEIDLSDIDDLNEEVVGHISALLAEKAWMFSRLTNLLREMLLYPHLKEVIEGYLELLAGRNLHDILFVIIGDLRLSPNFNDLEWVHKFLMRNNDELIQQTFQYLQKHLLKHPTQLHKTFEVIKAEWPPQELSFEGYTIKHCYAIFFFLRLAESSVDQLSGDHYGAWPPKYLLFNDLGEDEKNVRARLELMLSMLLNPQLDYQIYALFNDINDEDGLPDESKAKDGLIVLQAYLIEAWFALLNGIEGEDLEGTQKRTIEIYLEVLYNNTTPEMRQQLQNRWEVYTEMYQDITQYFPNLTKDRFRFFRKRQKTVNKLIRSFRAIIKKSRNRKI
ncbi:hypothetical protein BKI52_15900 [marine bacterium AO1-C]|nr:hypothetical protein BKI52_15900 [marine bacterium AO1-C]